MAKVTILDIQQFHDHDALEEFYTNTLQDHLDTRHKDIALPHKHNFYLSVLFTKGTGIHEVDFTSYEVKLGALFFLNPGQTHHWDLSDDTEGFIFFHTQEFYDLHYINNSLNGFPFFYSMHHSSCVYLNEKAFAKTAMLFEMILNESLSQDMLEKQAIISMIDLVYIQGTRTYYTQQKPSAIENKNSYYIKFRKLEDLIEQSYAAEKSPSAYAKILNMSAKHLNRITQGVVGKTASDVILERVLLEAKKELILQRDSFSQIALSLGYDDYAYFSRLFKKKTGETPSDFIKRYKRVN